jgi:hypothetical protein
MSAGKTKFIYWICFHQKYSLHHRVDRVLGFLRDICYELDYWEEVRKKGRRLSKKN